MTLDAQTFSGAPVASFNVEIGLPKLENPDLKEAAGAAIQKLKKELAEMR